MKDKKSINSFLFKNYIIIFFIMVVSLILTIYVTDFILENVIYRNIATEYIEPKDIYKIPFEEMDTKCIEMMECWIEILDENKKVIYVKGKKLDNIYQYDERFLYDQTSIHFDREKYPYWYNISPVEGPKGEPYLYVFKWPRDKFYFVVTPKLINTEKINSIGNVTYGTFLIVFLFFLFVSLIFYSRFTSKYIKTPLKYFRKGIREMERQNYSTRLDFHAQREFGEIRDAFNKMASKLEAVEMEKMKIAKSKQRMIVDISHDLKTPITSIYGFSKLLYDGEAKTKEDEKKYLKYIYNKSFYVSNLIEDFFSFSKLEDENFQLNFETYDFAEWLRQVISEYYPEIERKQFDLHIDISHMPILIEFDKKQMARAVINILSNAIKYNPPKTTLWIRCHRDEDQVLLTIADDGIGIREELKKVIFDSFVRGDKSRGTHDGSGLGLAITKKIIERHGGSMTLTSDQEAVTIFIITLGLKI
ncbi:HAMP domain-containing sensor histidine kinase [Crassaminicella profunda]|uniref:HAMP domain-containing sensor histidine kinase n=1 Tax=Crassaminicella profunda TaxID=1286698 RepID=UPI001CA6C8D8|nr:HAMP domain-containing sensor histidine kinase [Crassaminicella profunda]QZY54490.1 HAMP domain-containing histidine kinase [Crassaminicella profunda]